MEKSILITGGARSGKSGFAERCVLEMAEKARTGATYIATAQAFDAEMEARIAAHQARRDDRWQTINAPRDLVAALEQTDGGAPRLVDCLTLWLSNIMLAEDDWQSEAHALCSTIAQQSAPVVFVTNEVGSGIVPESKLGRAFRDAQGSLNQQVAAACDALYLVVAGHELRIK